MGNVRFIRASQNAGRKTSSSGVVYPRLINGSGLYTGAPALVQDSAYPMVNATLPDRHAIIWATTNPVANGGGLDVILEVDFGSSKSVQAIGLLGFRSFGAAAFPNNLGVEYLPGASYAPTGWTQLPLITLSGLVANPFSLITPASARYWRFRFYNAAGGSGFSVGGLLLATGMTDLGFLYSRADDTLVLPKTTVEGYGRVPIVTRTGRTFRRFALEYANIDSATKGTFDILAAETLPFMYVAPDDTVHECILEGEEYLRSHVWSPPDRWAFTFPMRSLP